MLNCDLRTRTYDYNQLAKDNAQRDTVILFLVRMRAPSSRALRERKRSLWGRECERSFLDLFGARAQIAGGVKERSSFDIKR